MDINIYENAKKKKKKKNRSSRKPFALGGLVFKYSI